MTPTLTAKRFQRFMETGRSSPALCGCVDETGKDCGEYVVKLRGAVDSREAGLVNELLAARLANHFKLTAPEPAVVVIENELIDLIAREYSERKTALELSVGPNFGTRHLTGVSTWPVDKAIPEEHFVTATEIFAFDALLQNPDRRYDNPNLFSRGDGLLIFDHDAAFSFLFDVFPSGAPWEVDNERYLTNHVFYRRLKSKCIELEEFIVNLVDLSEAVLEGFVAELPSEWDNQDNVRRIVEHIGALRQHGEEFADSIRRVLG